MSNDPTPPNPPRVLSALTYESTSPGGISGIRQGAWIALLILGILTICGGLCGGGIMALGAFMIHKMATSAPLGTYPHRVIPPTAIVVMWCIAGGFLLIPTGVGITQIICSVKIRTGSRAATIVAAVVVGLQIALVVTWMTISIVGAAMAGGGPIRFQRIVLGLLFGIATGLALGAVEWLLIAVLRERRGIVV